ncbi:MAG: class I SAM-dependent methyltransferase [Thermomicrobia bacterium]|nr:class I SAM-dependent methyltransferase [Thermomicrobia bacterium]MCA1722931.1 class I SAM-dependent methyltransferase [Thermomicrobia bacterium]
MVTREVQQQYQTTDPLRIRVETHVRYSERQIDLDAECVRALGLVGSESLLDVGCGPGAFPRYLRAHGHTGRLAGLDQSAAMIAAATATSAALEVEWFRGEANALPFPDGAFDVISARHMLYHVSEIPAALREFARVTGPGGRVFATTNGAMDLPAIIEMEHALAAQFGLPDVSRTNAPFNITNAKAILEAVYPKVDETILPNAFIFTTPEPIVAYIMSMAVVHANASDPTLLAEIHDWLTAETTHRLTTMGGIWRDPKDVGLYRCRVE